MRDQRDAGIEALARREAPDPAGDERSDDLPDHRHHDGAGEDPADIADRPYVDREAEHEEEERREHVAPAEEALLDLVAHRGLRENDASQQGPDRLREPELLSDRARPDHETDDGEEEELTR